MTVGRRRTIPVLLNFLHEISVSAEGQAGIASTGNGSCSHKICWGKSQREFGRSGVEKNAVSIAKHTRIL